MASPAEARTVREPAGKAASAIPWDVLAAVACGGAIGSVLRWSTSLVWPGPVSTLLVNVLGCLAIGVLMCVITELVNPHRLLRPFLGVGVLGGFTTFSAYVADALRLALTAPAAALGYLLATVLCCLLAVVVGMTATRALARGLRREAA
ncbi:CrcB family protein [Saccharopolyspora karakumensis]|uniref:Fluoride-specific ion channel FluC n=1 Tax=Saccharopolyspora karakumensis TaxID=2530386 RepID=A0A4R5B855_9PSEU|nr:CrcB family protein [Saccharopolyspora karakumensis]TDD81585.1 CrcB family protein [Saccharopolyspora karakumensis]